MFFVVLVQYVSAAMLVRLYGVASDVTRRQPHSKLPDPLAHSLSHPRLQCSLSLRCRSVIIDVSLTAGLHNAAF